MIQSAITITLVPEARGGPFVFSMDLPAATARAAKMGFHAVEVFAGSAEELGAATLASALNENNIKLAALGTGAGWVKHKLRLTDADPGVRKRAIDFIGGLIDLGASFRAPAIIGSMQGRWGDGVSREKALGWLAEALEELNGRAESRKVSLLFEPLNRYETNLFNTVEQTLEFLRPLKARSVKLLCDLFHMNIEEADIAAALKLAGGRLGHVHFADSNRHAIGFGHTSMQPIADMLREMKFEGYVSAEVFPFPDADKAARRTLESYRQFFAITEKAKRSRKS